MEQAQTAFTAFSFSSSISVLQHHSTSSQALFGLGVGVMSASKVPKDLSKLMARADARHLSKAKSQRPSAARDGTKQAASKPSRGAGSSSIQLDLESEARRRQALINNVAQSRRPPSPPSPTRFASLRRVRQYLIARPLNLKTGPPRYFYYVTYGLASYIAFYIFSVYQGLKNGEDIDPKTLPDDLSDRFDKTAEWFDNEVKWEERLYGILRLRKRLLRKAKGHVLESAVGTGRNVDYYRLGQCQSVTMIDISAPMLEVARRKWKAAHPEYKNAFFRHQSSMERVPIPDGQDGFDTVIETMGICSTPDPVGLLRNLANLAKPDTGRIFLLEHGKSHYNWINELLDKEAPKHANQYGCWWNKDVGKIIEESGLEVAEMKRYAFGTVWWVELKPKRVVVTLPAVDTNEEKKQISNPKARTAWWSLWA
jgi:methyltransferase OMS1, mitochondrial